MILERLVKELLEIKGMLIVVDSHGTVSEMHTVNIIEPDFHQGWATIESNEWHIHMNIGEVEEVQFVEAKDDMHASISTLYYVRFSNSDRDTLIRFYFPNPWLDENENITAFQSEKLQLSEKFRDFYVNHPGIIFIQI